MGGGGLQNASFKIATKQCLTVRKLIVEKVDCYEVVARTDRQTNKRTDNANSRVASRLKTTIVV